MIAGLLRRVSWSRVSRGWKRWAHRLGEFGEWGGEAERRCGLDGEFVVPAAKVLHEGLAGGDPGRQPKAF